MNPIDGMEKCTLGQYTANLRPIPPYHTTVLTPVRDWLLTHPSANVVILEQSVNYARDIVSYSLGTDQSMPGTEVDLLDATPCRSSIEIQWAGESADKRLYEVLKEAVGVRVCVFIGDDGYALNFTGTERTNKRQGEVNGRMTSPMADAVYTYSHRSEVELHLYDPEWVGNLRSASILRRMR